MNKKMRAFDCPFYVAVVEVGRKCKTGRLGSIGCHDKVSLIDSRVWKYQPHGKERFLYENRTQGKGIIPTLTELVSKASWRTELCPNTTIEVQ